MDYNARYYDPYLGRFVSADTIVPIPGNPVDWNRYAYVRNNPVVLVDGTGHAPNAPPMIDGQYTVESATKKYPSKKTQAATEVAPEPAPTPVAAPTLMPPPTSTPRQLPTLSPLSPPPGADAPIAMTVASLPTPASQQASAPTLPSWMLKGLRGEGTYWVLSPIVAVDGNLELLGDMEHSRIQLSLGVQGGLGGGGSVNAGPVFTNADLDEYGRIVNHAGLTVSDDIFLAGLSSELGGLGALLGFDIDYGWADGGQPRNLFIGVAGAGEEFSVWYGRSLVDAGLILDTGELEGQFLFWPFQVDLW